MSAAPAASDGHPVGRMPRQPLRRELNKWQIFMIVISTTVGVGFFTNSGEILSFAGPATALLAFGLVGLLACMVMEGVSEMVVIWPIPNPMVEFVRHFVDRDLAIVVCFAYWYTYAISFAAIITTAGDVVIAYWGDEKLPKVLVFVLFPIITFLINFNSVSIFGWIEFVGGLLKLLVVLLVFVTMITINLGGAGNVPIHSKFIKMGFQFNEQVVNNKATAVILAIGNAVYPYIGIEAVTTTAFEARNPRELKMPAKSISYIVTIIYLFSVLGFTLNVGWNCNMLTRYYQQPFTTKLPQDGDYICSTGGSLPRRDDANASSTASTFSNDYTLPTLAIDRTQSSAATPFSSFVNVCLLYSALSTANSALFTASRTLYGLGQSVQVDSRAWPRPTRFLARFGTTNAFGVPAWAIAAGVSFAWVPLLSLDGGAQDTQQVLISIGSTACVLVWASQSLAFARYHAWLWRHRRRLVGPYARYDRWERTDLSSWLGSWQPALARASLAGCVLVVLVFASAGLWNGRGNMGLKALNIYLGPGILLLLFAFLKVLRRPWKRGWAERWVVLGEWEQLRDTLDALNDLVLPDQRRVGEGVDMDCEDGEGDAFEMRGRTVPERAPRVELRHSGSTRERR